MLREVKGMCGATIAATDPFRRCCSAHFFELADEPVIVVIVASNSEVTVLLERLQREPLNLFYVKTAIEFGVVGAHSSLSAAS